MAKAERWVSIPLQHKINNMSNPTTGGIEITWDDYEFMLDEGLEDYLDEFIEN